MTAIFIGRRARVYFASAVCLTLAAVALFARSVLNLRVSTLWIEYWDYADKPAITNPNSAAQPGALLQAWKLFRAASFPSQVEDRWAILVWLSAARFAAYRPPQTEDNC